MGGAAPLMACHPRHTVLGVLAVSQVPAYHKPRPWAAWAPEVVAIWWAGEVSAQEVCEARLEVLVEVQQCMAGWALWWL